MRYVAIATVLVFGEACAAVWHVDKDNASGTRNGTTWATAFATIQEGIDAAYAAGGGEVWVAGGVYDEMRPNNLGALVLREGVHVFGRFAGNEDSREQREWMDNATIIDARKSKGGYWPAVHAVMGANDCTLEGFVVLGGNAGADGDEACGGGLFNAAASPVVRYTLFYANEASQRGGAVYNRDSSLEMTGCIFVGNTAEKGGAVYNEAGSPLFTTCMYFSNSCTYSVEDRGGGGVYNEGGTPVLQGCAFVNNHLYGCGGALASEGAQTSIRHCLFTRNYTQGPSYASQMRGGAIHVMSGTVSIVNCTLWDNDTAMRGWMSPPYAYGGAVYVSGGNVIVRNSILFNNIPDQISGSANVAYSALQGGWTGEGNISDYPLFEDAEAGDFRLKTGSPCIDSGIDVSEETTDIQGTPRPFGGAIDMGAYEFTTGSAPSAGLQADTPVGQAPLTVNFTDVASADMHAGALRLGLWDYGDNGDTSLHNENGMCYTITSECSQDVNSISYLQSLLSANGVHTYCAPCDESDAYAPLHVSIAESGMGLCIGDGLVIITHEPTPVTTDDDNGCHAAGTLANAYGDSFSGHGGGWGLLGVSVLASAVVSSRKRRIWRKKA